MISHPDAKKNGMHLTDIYVDILKKGNPQFKYLKWLLQATGDNPRRSLALWCVYVDGNEMVTVDGCRLHKCAKLPELDNGLWYPESVTAGSVRLRKLKDLKFPNYREVIPDDETPTRIRVEAQLKWGEEMVLALRLGSAVNVEYLRDAIWGGGVLKRDYEKRVALSIVTEPATHLKFDDYNVPGPWTLRFPDWSRSAVIMPIRVGPPLIPN